MLIQLLLFASVSHALELILGSRKKRYLQYFQEDLIISVLLNYLWVNIHPWIFLYFPRNKPLDPEVAMSGSWAYNRQSLMTEGMILLILISVVLLFTRWISIYDGFLRIGEIHLSIISYETFNIYYPILLIGVNSFFYSA